MVGFLQQIVSVQWARICLQLEVQLPVRDCNAILVCENCCQNYGLHLTKSLFPLDNLQSRNGTFPPSLPSRGTRGEEREGKFHGRNRSHSPLNNLNLG